jgi:GST-like protein
MIDLYYADTGNSVRAAIALEECELAYRRHIVDMAKREHKTPEFLKLNPFGLVPAMVDHDGPGGERIVLTQSGAIMLYAAEKAGRFLPSNLAQRAVVLQWCMMAVSDASPASALLKYMTTQIPDLTPSSRRFLEERFLGFMSGVEHHLASTGRDYLVGEISLADLALFPVVRMRRSMLEQTAQDFGHLLRWADRLAARPAVIRATTF